MLKRFELVQLWLSKFMKSSLWRYLVIGGSTVLIDFGILILLHEAFKLPVLLAASVSYWTSIGFNFLMNHYWTFKARGEVRMSLVYYGLLLGFNYAFTLGFIAAAGLLGFHYSVAKIVAIAISLSWTYLLYKKIVFR